MKKFTYALYIFLITSVLNAQDHKVCLPDGLYLYNQQQIDNFPIDYPYCTTWNSKYSQRMLRSADGLADLDEFITEQMDIHHIPGLSASIVLGDSIVWGNNFGFADLENNIPVSDLTIVSP